MEHSRRTVAPRVLLAVGIAVVAVLAYGWTLYLGLAYGMGSGAFSGVAFARFEPFLQVAVLGGPFMVLGAVVLGIVAAVKDAGRLYAIAAVLAVLPPVTLLSGTVFLYW